MSVIDMQQLRHFAEQTAYAHRTAAQADMEVKIFKSQLRHIEALRREMARQGRPL